MTVTLDLSMSDFWGNTVDCDPGFLLKKLFVAVCYIVETLVSHEKEIKRQCLSFVIAGSLENVYKVPF